MWVELGAVLISSRLPKGLPFIGRLIIIFCVARRCREQALLSSLRLCIGSRGVYCGAVRRRRSRVLLHSYSLFGAGHDGCASIFVVRLLPCG